MPRIAKYEIGQKITRQIFFVSFVMASVGYIYDLLTCTSASLIVVAIEVVSIAIFIACSLFFLVKRKYFEQLYLIGGYTIVATIYSRYFFESWSSDLLSLYLLRDTLFICLVLTILSIGVGRIHSFIVGGICLLMLTFLNFYKGNDFLQQNYLVCAVIIVGYSVLVNYFMLFIDSLLKDGVQKSELIAEQNTELSGMNQSLIFSQETLKQQSRQLAMKNEQLEELNRQKDLFLSIVAHDLRNPVSAMYSFSNILLNKYETHTSERRLLILQNMVQMSHQTSNLLDNLLDWSKNQSNNVIIRPVVFPIANAIQSVISLVELLANQKEINIKQNISVHTTVFADEQMIETVLRNILTNAIKYSHVGGEIEMQVMNQDTKLLLIIRDSGVGMDNTIIDKLFSNTKNTSQTTLGTNGEKGTGLGLMICKEFIEKNNGRFWIESEIGKGCTFCIELPMFDTKLANNSIQSAPQFSI